MSVDAALWWAYTHGDLEHGTAAAVERQIATFAVDRYGRPGPSPRNLGGTENQAHLAGQILGIVQNNTRPAFQVLCVARYARLDSTKQDAACNLLARIIGADMPPTVGLLTVARLMRGGTGRAINVSLMAEELGVGQSTVFRWQAAVRRFVREVEAPGIATITPLLEIAKVV